ncbi:MAG: CvpA family protein [Pseudomonadota bacterium]
MILVDYLIIGIIVVSAVIGLFRGFFPEVLSLVTWVAAIYVGWHYSGSVEQMLDGKLDSPALEIWLARFIVFAAVLIIGGLIGQLVAFMIERTGLSGTDRALGFVFGMARGFVVLGFVVIVGQLLSLEEESWWKQSQFISVGERVAGVVRDVLPDNISDRIKPPEAEPELDPTDPASLVPALVDPV